MGSSAVRAWLSVALVACAEPATPVAEVTATATPSVVSTETQPPAPLSASASPAPGSAQPNAQLPPSKVERSGKTWPFHAWNRAEAVAFNQFGDRPGVPLIAYDDSVGESPHVAQRKPLDARLAKQAVDLVFATEGGVEVSKCPFPRHAVVLYEDALPVASINVCFTCGDILLWPRWSPAPDWSQVSDKQMKAIELHHAKQMKLYEGAFPKWQAFFRDDVGMAIDATYR